MLTSARTARSCGPTFADDVSAPAALPWLHGAGTDPITGSLPKVSCQPLYVRMLTPSSALIHALTWAACAALTPWDASIDWMADRVAVVLHDTPANARKNVRMTSSNRNGLTRRAPGSPARAAEFTRPLKSTAQPTRSRGARRSSHRLHSRVAVYRHTYTRPRYLPRSEGTSSRACAASPWSQRHCCRSARAAVRRSTRRPC